MKKELEKICYWKNYGVENPMCASYSLECSGKLEEDCRDYKSIEDVEKEDGKRI